MVCKCNRRLLPWTIDVCAPLVDRIVDVCYMLRKTNSSNGLMECTLTADSLILEAATIVVAVPPLLESNLVPGQDADGGRGGQGGGQLLISAILCVRRSCCCCCWFRLDVNATSRAGGLHVVRGPLGGVVEPRCGPDPPAREVRQVPAKQLKL